jgi:simple sugar transport system ATP-binding protein
MRDKGCAIVIITHKLNEVLEISDRVTILRKGRALRPSSPLRQSEGTNRINGRQGVELSIERPENRGKESILSTHHLTVVNDEAWRLKRCII